MAKNVSLIALAVCLLAAAAAALDFEQKHWYGQGILALPMGDFGDVANLGIGAGVGLSVPHSAELNFRGEVSYIHFLTEDYPGGDYSFSMIPILALAEYHLTDSPAYLLGGLGFVIGRSKVEFDNEDRSDTDTEIGLALGGGFALSPSLDLEGRLNLVSDANSISAHLRFRF